MADLCHVAHIKKRRLNFSTFDELRNLRSPQCRYPVDAFGSKQILADAGSGRRPPVSDQHDPLDPEAMPQLSNGFSPFRIGHFSFKHLYGHRTAICGAQESNDNLQLVFFPVATVAKPGQRTAAAFKIRRGDVRREPGCHLEDVFWPEHLQCLADVQTTSPWLHRAHLRLYP